MGKRDALRKKYMNREISAQNETSNLVTDIKEDLEIQDTTTVDNEELVEQPIESTTEIPKEIKKEKKVELEVSVSEEPKDVIPVENAEPEKPVSEDPVSVENIEPEESISEDPVSVENIEPEESVSEDPVSVENIEPEKPVSEVAISAPKLSDFKAENTINEVRYYRAKKEAPKRYVVHVTESFKNDFENKVREYERKHAPENAKKISLNKFIVAIFQQYIANDFEDIRIYDESSVSIAKPEDLWSIVERKDKVIGCSFPVDMANKIEQKAMEIQMPVSQLIISGLYTFTLS